MVNTTPDLKRSDALLRNALTEKTKLLLSRSLQWFAESAGDDSCARTIAAGGRENRGLADKHQPMEISRSRICLEFTDERRFALTG